ncbi:DUF4349 domain-containing protein [Streptomyces mangrovisoli]|uniref:DUF4349 domain-containing protein n=1 Tax=Streptomyces mangrovisoli TaxID=1428628 RepID=A0A1J4NMM0_9ACTN|nr:DUF4349 domain-containing protein [Streptomyces mangrovisoli]OIJ62549.1 hypothetical protein WN71_038925 [Streptomyces mangrovisoli]
MRPRPSARPVRTLSALLLAASIAVAGCGAGSSGADSAGAKAAEQADSKAQGPGSGGARSTATTAPQRSTATEAPRLTSADIVRTASLTVRVGDVAKALAAARTTTEDAGGYVGDETTDRDSAGREHTRLVLRVPSGRYDEVLTALQGGGTLLARTSKAEDVTDQVVDVDSRVKSQRASVARIRALMDRAGKLSDVVELEGELSSREADLESLLAQQASLKDRVSLATITLTLTEAPVTKAAKDTSPGFGDAVAGGWDVFVTVFRWLALAIGAALPFAALTALLAVAWLRVVRPRRAPRPATATLAPTAGPTAGPAPAPAAGPLSAGGTPERGEGE